MLKSREGHHLELANQPNGHILILGKSGFGKTYFCCRHIEENIAENRKALIFDYSGSYTEEELRKNDLATSGGIKTFNPAHTPYYFMVKENDEKKFQKNIVDTLVKVLSIQGYTQEEILQEGVARHMKKRHTINFSELFMTLRELLLEKKELQETDAVKNLSKLLQRLRSYSDIEKIHIIRCGTAVKRGKERVTIVQLSDYSASQRNFLTNFLITILWKEIISNNGCEYDLIYLDEFQHLMKKKHGVVYDFLREGRKRGISLILCSQFMDGYDGEQKDALMQCGNILLFRPTLNDLNDCAKLIDMEDLGAWKKILKNLKIGQAVLLGHYYVNNKKIINEKPVICIIQKKKEGEDENDN